MLVLAFLLVPLLEVLAFVEVARAIGWLPALLILLATSLAGRRLLRIEGRATLERVARALAERRAPGAAALDAAVATLGAALLVIPGFVTDALGVLLLLPPVRRSARRWMAGRYGGRLLGFAARAGRFAPGGSTTAAPADVDSTAVEVDPRELRR